MLLARGGGAAQLHRDGGPRLRRRERGAAAPDERVRHGSHDLKLGAASILRAERPHGSRRRRGGRGGGAAAADVDAADGGRPADGRAAGRAPSLSDASTPTALTAASVATTRASTALDHHPRLRHPRHRAVPHAALTAAAVAAGLAADAVVAAAALAASTSAAPPERHPPVMD